MAESGKDVMKCEDKKNPWVGKPTDFVEFGQRRRTFNAFVCSVFLRLFCLELPDTEGAFAYGVWFQQGDDAFLLLLPELLRSCV